MSAETKFFGMSNECERMRREDFMKFVSDNEERVRNSLCNTGEFRTEPFCRSSHSTQFSRSFLWKAPQSRPFGS
jgi:hypothetical protein